MGTRHLILAIVDNEYKIAQYGQWDGYFSGQGLEILNFINTELNTPEKEEHFKQKLRSLTFLTQETYEKLFTDLGIDISSNRISSEDSAKFMDKYPYLSRDCGSNILSIVCNEEVTGLQDSHSFASDSLMCEYAYVVDMDNRVVEFYTGFNKAPLDSNNPKERFKDYPIVEYSIDTNYYPVKYFTEFKFDDIVAMTKEDIKKLIIQLEQQENEEED